MSCEASPELPEAPETFGVGSLPLYEEKVLASVDAEQISESSVGYQRAEFFGYKSFTNDAPDPNAGTVLMGFRNQKFVYIIQAGGSKVIEAPRGQKFDLSQMYIKGLVGDGVVVQYS